MNVNILPKLKEPLIYSSSEIVNNLLFVCGGCNSQGKAQKSVQCLDINNKDDFLKLSEMPRNKVGAAITHIEQKLITIGGIYDKQCPLDKVDIYDIETEKWFEVEPLYQAAQNISLITKDEVIFSVGGLAAGMNALSSFQSFDIRQSHWQKMPNMTNRYYSAGVHLFNENLYVMGGRIDKRCNNNCESFDFRAGKWRLLPEIPDDYKNIFNSTTILDNSIYVIGGLNEDIQKGFSNLVYKFNLENETWTKMPNLLKARGDFGLFAKNDKLVVAGGLGQIPKLGESIEMFDIKLNKWHEETDLPSFHGSSSKCSNGDSIFLIGGMTPTGPSVNVTSIEVC